MKNENEIIRSKKDFVGLLHENGFKKLHYLNFRPYYEDTFPLMFYLAKTLPNGLGLRFYKKYLFAYNNFIEKVGFGIRQHSLCVKEISEVN